MSNIYIQEPPTSGKVLLKTSVGDIDIELWARECPKACRNFIQLCMEGYYNGTIFHRIVKGFIAQGGDPNGDGSGGESIYGEPFKDEFHSRLRFSRRGLVAMANSSEDDNGSQFFFTMGPTPELQNKHTLFGKVTGDTLYNMLKLEDGLVDHNERPLYPPKIIKAEILSNPFSDIVPRVLKKEEKKAKKKVKEKGVKNFGLLSFGEEAEEDEDQTNDFVKKNAGKAKSTHDVLDDPKLSKETGDLKKRTESDIEKYDKSSEDEENVQETAARIKDKLSSKKTSKDDKTKKKDAKKEGESDEDDDDYFKTIEQEKKEKQKKKAEEIRQEIVSLKKQYKQERKAKDDLIDKQLEKDVKKETSNEILKEYLNEKDKYAHLKKTVPKKGSAREEFTLQLLSKFRNKLDSLKEKTTEKNEEDDDKMIEEDIKTDDWLSHKLNFEDTRVPVLAKDASTKSDDWYDVFDPRNPLNKRKRGEARSTDKDIKKSKV
ncbi:unnamed protein product [Hermetia illucens]|uniref:Spliceosome-associated protein CWC27 homolog n=1 Tax=Hermetia illucens TaxID=343691 RepID=A0A7R8UK02_HERIL|nr:spliceosome-associated protein CWC27 homolog [Hermetia illucens]CAD7082273.1 unnamed protein product [Hermetia illucens]